MSEDPNWYFAYEGSDEIYAIDMSQMPPLIPETSLLAILHREAQAKDEEVAVSNDPNLPEIIRYVNERPVIRDKPTIQVLDEWGVYRDYEQIREDNWWMIENMYNFDRPVTNIDTDHYFRLYKADYFKEEYERFIAADEDLKAYRKSRDLFFYCLPLDNIPDYYAVLDDLYKLDFIFDAAEEFDIIAFIAGEWVFRTLMGLTKRMEEDSTVEIFLVADEDQEKYSKFVDYITISGRKTELDEYHEIRLVRGPGYIYIENEDISVKIHLTLYVSFSEILHAQDIDCCCIGWDGTNVWMTEKCKYALFKGYNTVDLRFASNYKMFETVTDYESRLARFAVLGISIKVPRINDYQLLCEYIIDENSSKTYAEVVSQIQYFMKYWGANINNETIDNLLDVTFSSCEFHIDAIPARGLSYISLLEQQYLARGFPGRRTRSKYEQNLNKYSRNDFTKYNYIILSYYRNRRVSEEILSKLKGKISTMINAQTQLDEIMVKKSHRSIDIISMSPTHYVDNPLPYDVLRILTISSDIYELMQIYPGVGIPREARFTPKSPGDLTIHRINYVPYDDIEEWYIGRYFERKDNLPLS